MAEKNKKTKLFAAIDVGSYEMTLKIFEISPGAGLKAIDTLKHRLALGSDSYTSKKISYRKMEELFKTLESFKAVMKEYGVNAYRAYGTSAFREIENADILLEQIRSRTGIELAVLSNSEQRFLDYKAAAAREKIFDKAIESGTAFVDVGGGSIQLSLFDDDTLVQTQSLKLGVLRLHERISEMRPRSSQTEELLDEMIGSQMRIYHKLYMKDREIKNLIIMDEYVSPRFKKAVENADEDGRASALSFIGFYERLLNLRDEEAAELLDLPEENVPLFRIAAGIFYRIINALGAVAVWAPGAEICDGIAYEYAQDKKLISLKHDFEEDILDSARMISRRYQGSLKHGEIVETAALCIFDALKGAHGMGERERLLLSLSCILHDCGKYINMMNVGECSFAVIENTEIIGLSHRERMMIAYAVKYLHVPFEYYDELPSVPDMDSRSYLTVAKLTAILRLANAFGKGKRDKIKKLKASLKEDTLIISVDARQELLYEKERFEKKTAFFEEVFGIHPVIKGGKGV